MGINGLLPALKPIAKQVHVSKYKGQRAAVDGYSWLHKGAYCCARELCEGSWTDKFVIYFMSRVQLLRSNGIEPVVVFDGGRLPIKGQEEQSRHRARKEARDKAAAHLAAGNITAAVECYQRCVDITPAMAKQVIEELKVQGVSFIVAPYEADAQMAYLAKRGDVQLVITEDSDLLAYGCPRVLYKLDRSGSGEEVSLSDLPNCSSLPLSSFTSDQFLQLCVMAGCDFLAQLPGIGLKKAHGLLRKYQSFTKVLKMLRFNGTRISPDYEVRFQMALWAFRHCRVYCPTAKALQHLVPLPACGIGAADVDVPAAVKQLEQDQQQQQLDFLGPQLPQNIAQGIAEGHLDPSSHKPFDLAAIYAGCRNLPPHIAAQMDAATGAVPHLLAYHHSQHGKPGSQGGNSGAAAAAGSGGYRRGSSRVGLARKHAFARGQQKLSWAGAKGSAAGAEAKAAALSTSSTRQKATLGIAKFFSTSSTAAAAAAGVQQAGAAAAPAPAAEPAAKPAAAAPDMQNSIRQALHALRQQQQQRQQQEQAEKQQLLSDIQAHGLQEAAATPGTTAADDLLDPSAAAAAAVETFELPAAKRQRTETAAEHLLTPSAEVMCSCEGAATAAADNRALDTSLLLDQLQQQQQGCQRVQSEDSSLGALKPQGMILQQQVESVGAAGPQCPIPGNGFQTLQDRAAFLQGLGHADPAAPLAATPDSSDSFGQAAAAAATASAAAQGMGAVSGNINQCSEGPSSLPGSFPVLSANPASGLDDQPCTGMGISLGSGTTGNLGLDNSSITPSLDSSLGLPAASGGRGAAVSALTALFRGAQPQQQSIAQDRAVEALFDAGLNDRIAASEQQDYDLLGSCPSGRLLGQGFSDPAGALGDRQCGNFSDSAGASSQGLGSCGIGSQLGECEGGTKRQLGTAWQVSGIVGNGLDSHSSFMTPQCPEQELDEDGGEDEIISPPRTHDLALGGSSSQPWKRLQQSLRGSRGLKARGFARTSSKPLEPGGSLQGLRDRLGLQARRSRLSNQVDSSPEEGLGSDLGLSSLSDDMAGEVPAAEVELPAGCSMGSDGLGDPGLGQHVQPMQKRRCSGFFSRLSTQQKPACSPKCPEQQQDQDESITIPDSEDEGGDDAAAAAAAAAEAPGPAEAGLPLGGSSTDGSSLDASNDENATPDIHSIAHVRKYARLATKVVDRVQRQQQQPVLQQTQQQQQQVTSQQQRRAPFGTCGAVGNAAAAAAAAVAGSQALGGSLKRGLLRSSNQPVRGSGTRQRPGHRKSLAAEISSLKYDPNMFVPVQPLAHDLTEQQNDADAHVDGSCDVGVGRRQKEGLGQHASQTGPSKVGGRIRSMFGIKAGTTGHGSLATKPFKAPWLSQAAASSAGDGIAGEAAGDEGGFGAFGGFACGILAGGQGLRRR